MRKHIVALVCGAVIVAGAGLLAQSGSIRLVPQPAQTVKLAQPWRTIVKSGETKIVGSVVDVKQTPVKHARLQLRNLTTGKVEQVTESDDNGEYEFAVDESGTFVVEMILMDGHILALSNAGVLARYETLHTVVQLPGRWDLQQSTMVMQQSATSYFGMSAQTTMTAATMNLAIEASIAPINAGEPVSATAPK